MRVLWLVSVLTLGWSWSGTAAAAEPRVVAVFDIRDLTERLDDKAIENLTAYFTSQIDKGESLRTVSRADIRLAIQRLKRESYKECYDERCQIEVGKEVAAEFSVLTQIVAIGSKCAVTATMYNLRTAASERTASEKSTCDVDALVGALERAAKVLGGGGPTSAPPPPVAQRADPPPPAPPPPAAEPRSDPPVTARMQPETSLPVLPIALVGSGIAVAAAGGVFLALAKGHEEDANDVSFVGSQFEAQAATEKQTVGLILIGAGGAISAAGAVLWILAGGEDDSVAFYPAVTDDGAVATVRWRL